MWWSYALGAAGFAALTTIFAKLGVWEVSANVATAVRTIVITLMAWGIVFGTGEIRGVTTLTNRTLWFLILSGLSTGASWICYFQALQRGPASLVAAVDKLSLALTIALAALFLGEALTVKTAIGAGLIVLGTVILIR